jgi:predicted lipoprotein with Yx(FWY)xxD motif
MSRRRIALASATAVVGLGSLVLQSASIAGAHPAAAARARPAADATAASGGARISLRKTQLGMLLVNSHGFTLYAFSRDSRNADRCASTPGCTSIWPLVRTGARPIAGPGVKRSLLGTIKVHGGLQVTYAGHPLYTYSSDAGPGSTSYVGKSQFKGVWRGVRASGATVS